MVWYGLVWYKRMVVIYTRQMNGEYSMDREETVRYTHVNVVGLFSILCVLIETE